LQPLSEHLEIRHNLRFIMEELSPQSHAPSDVIARRAQLPPFSRLQPSFEGAVSRKYQGLQCPAGEVRSRA
jgi:hypothetical protein